MASADDSSQDPAQSVHEGRNPDTDDLDDNKNHGSIEGIGLEGSMASSHNKMANFPSTSLHMNADSPHLTSSIGRSRSKRQAIPRRKSQSGTGDGEEFEMADNIQKSTIMMKRLRSKSESKKSENEYGLAKDPDQERHGEAPAYKRYLQEHLKEEGGNISRSHAVFPPQVFVQLPPAREDGACVVCLQSYDGAGNQIVLCDSCDRGFHQLCHSPPIDSKYVKIADLEWTCYICNLPLSATSSQDLPVLTEDMSLTGQQVPLTVKEHYLKSLSKASLLRLITRIESSSPATPMYPMWLSSPTVSHSEGAPTTPRAAVSLGKQEPLVKRDNQQDSNQDMMISPEYQMPGTQADYFDSLVSHFKPSLHSPSADFQQTNTASVTPRNSFGSSEAISSSSKGIGGTSSQPATPSSARITAGRQTPNSGSGTGVSGAYHSVKAQDLPPYEEMIFMAIAELKQEAGSAPKAILDWVADNYPVPDTFRASCGQAISKAAKKGRLLKEGSLYKLKPGYTYPRRATRQGGSTRARSQSYNSALPLGIPMIDRSSRSNSMSMPVVDHINSIIDASLYNMLPSPIGASTFPGNMVAPTHQGMQQSVHPLSAQPLTTTGSALQMNNNSCADMKSASGMSNLVGLGVTNDSGVGDADFRSGADAGGGRPASRPTTTGQTSFLAINTQGIAAFSSRVLQTQRTQQQQQPFAYDRTWVMPSTAGNQHSRPGLAGAGPAATGMQQSSMFPPPAPPGQLMQPRQGSMAAPFQYTGPTFGIGSIGIPAQLQTPPQPQSPQGMATFPSSQTPLAHPLVPNRSLPGQGARMFQSLVIPENNQFPQHQPQQQQQQQQQHQHQQQQQQHQQQQLYSAQSSRVYGSLSLPASPQDISPHLMSSHSLFRDPTLRIQPQHLVAAQLDTSPPAVRMGTNTATDLATRRYHQSSGSADGLFNAATVNPGLLYQQLAFQQQQQHHHQQYTNQQTQQSGPLQAASPSSGMTSESSEGNIMSQSDARAATAHSQEPNQFSGGDTDTAMDGQGV
ncbi:hypothetical protein BGX28_002726 [Mortierella sp. GBA30]|nr:hypothetical protein BGX28_002726 [Mortierella sp. GBA30]